MEYKRYKTIAARASIDFVEKRSDFIGYLCPCQTEEEAVAFIAEIRAAHRKATHNVYAYILREGNTTRYSDDGEPQGTAGVPVLDVLQKQGLTDVCCVVTRYFGGILLGGGGLVRAYSHAAALSISVAQILYMTPCTVLQLTCSYTLYGRVSTLLPEYGAKILESDFFEEVALRVQIKSELCQDFSDKLIDLTNGKVLLSIVNEMYADMQ